MTKARADQSILSNTELIPLSALRHQQIHMLSCLKSSRDRLKTSEAN